MGHQLTPHFHSDELTRSPTAQRLQLDNIPPAPVLANLHRLANEILEPIRALTGLPMRINSGYRSKRLNAVIGGHPNSYHLDGLAADFEPPKGWTHDRLQKAIAASPIPFDLIMEERAGDGGHWLHVQMARPGAQPRRMVRDAELDKTGGPIKRTTAG